MEQEYITSFENDVTEHIFAWYRKTIGRGRWEWNDEHTHEHLVEVAKNQEMFRRIADVYWGEYFNS